VEVSALKQPSLPGLRGALPLLRLQADDRLIALTRRGNESAFEVLVGRYQSRLLAFCRHMLASREDAEDVLQEVFAAAFNAILADDRPINVRPWLYRIARNRCLNHLRRNTAIGVDSMDIHFADAGQTTGEKVAKREEFRLLLEDIGRLPETQRTALLLREMEALSYQQISEVMDTTVPSVKSLLVRARVTLAEVAESRRLTCDEVRLELGSIAEGLTQETAPVRRHLKECARCREFRGHLRGTTRALAAVLPVAPLLLFKHLALKKLLLAKLGSSAGAGGAGVSTATAGGASTAGAAGAAGLLTAGGGGASVVTAGAGALATKAVAGLAAAAIVTAGAVEARHTDHVRVHRQAQPAFVAQAPAQAPVVAPRVLTQTQQLETGGTPAFGKHHGAKPKQPRPKVVAVTTPPTPAPPVTAKPLPGAQPPIVKPTTQQVSSTTVLPPQPQPQQTAAGQPQQGTAPSSSSTSGSSTSSPPAGTTGPTGPSDQSASGTTTSGSPPPDGSSPTASGPGSAGSAPLTGTTPSNP
jgi:RNA polymerase sigma factor (sigma-70 family)